MIARKGRLQHWDYSMLLRSISFMVSREQFILNWEYLIWFTSVDIFLIIPGNFYGLINVNPLKLFILRNNMPNSNVSWHFTDSRNVVKNAFNAGDLGLIHGLRRSPREGNSNPFQYSYLENHMDRGAWGLQSMGLQRVRHDWATCHFQELSLWQ